jgi:hypothetical protein
VQQWIAIDFEPLGELIWFDGACSLLGLLNSSKSQLAIRTNSFSTNYGTGFFWICFLDFLMLFPTFKSFSHMEKGTWTVGGHHGPFLSIAAKRKGERITAKASCGDGGMGEKSNNKGRNIIGKQ